MNAPDSVAKSLIEGMSEYGKNLEYTERVAKSVVASMYLGRCSTLAFILLAMSLLHMLHATAGSDTVGF